MAYNLFVVTALSTIVSKHLLEAPYFRQLRLGRERPRSWDANVPTITFPIIVKYPTCLEVA
jgi:hypothetical protein